MSYRNVAIIGATGLVGLELLSVIEERAGQIDELRLYASDQPGGREIMFHGISVEVHPVSEADFRGIDVAFFMAGADVSRIWVPRAREAGALAIDNSSAFRRNPDVPLIVPEVNPGAADCHRGLIANPNCSVIQLVTAIHPIHTLSPIRRLIVSTYQSISGAGRGEHDRLLAETRERLNGHPSQVAFNLWPGIDRLLEDGHYFEEEKVLEETKKILEDPSMAVTATVVRVPVLRGHSISVYLETERPVPIEEAWRVLEAAPGVEAVGKDADLFSLSPVAVSGKDAVRVGRLRKDRAVSRGILLWAVADNLRKGAALNAIQIAERVFEPNVVP
jgi:aspartate-semialdehyde dehydrogenase